MTYVTERTPPPNRRGKVDGELERHLTEGAIMIALAEWLFDQGASDVTVHPDGMHLKTFDILALLQARGFRHVEPDHGKTSAGGLWLRGVHRLKVYSRPGLGDVVGVLDGTEVEIEAKGGITNTLHSGQRSLLRRHLYEAVGQLLDSRSTSRRLIAAVPRHRETEVQAKRMVARCRAAGIELALVSEDGSVELVAG